MNPSLQICRMFSRETIHESLCSRAFRGRKHSRLWSWFVTIVGVTHCGNSYFTYWKRGPGVEPLSWFESLRDFLYR